MSGALGENEFVAFEQLSHCIEAIESLASECRLPPLSDDHHTQWKSLTHPLRIVALGETNAGKSTLLNALIGHPLCPSTPLPTTRHIIHYQWSETKQDHSDDPSGWQTSSRPIEALRRLELIDTPGLDSETRSSVLDALPSLTSADLILIVFPVENTWTASTWKALSKFHPSTLDHTALIIQRADQKSHDDLHVIGDHMQQLCLKQTGRELPIFPVAAELALASKTSTEAARKGWSASGFSRFEQWIKHHLLQSPDRRHRFSLNCQMATQRLREIESALDLRKRHLDDDGWFLAKLEKEVNEQCQKAIAAAPRALATERKSYAREVVAISAFCRSRLSWPFSFWGLIFGHATASRIEQKFSELLQQWIIRLGHLEAHRLLESCRQHWTEIQNKIRERLEIEPNPSILSGDRATTIAEQFSRDLVRSLPHIMSHLRIRASLDKPLRQRNRRLKTICSLALITMTAAGLCGALGQQQPAIQILIGSAAIWLIAMIYAWINRRRIIDTLGDQLWASIETIESTMTDDYAEAVSNLFNTYANGLIDVRRQLAQRQSNLQPHTKRLDQLYLKLKTIEHEAD